MRISLTTTVALSIITTAIILFVFGSSVVLDLGFKSSGCLGLALCHSRLPEWSENLL